MRSSRPARLKFDPDPEKLVSSFQQCLRLSTACRMEDEGGGCGGPGGTAECGRPIRFPNQIIASNLATTLVSRHSHYPSLKFRWFVPRFNVRHVALPQFLRGRGVGEAKAAVHSRSSEQSHARCSVQKYHHRHQQHDTFTHDSTAYISHATTHCACPRRDAQAELT